MMLGEMRFVRGMYNAHEPTLAGEFSPERLATAIAALPSGIYPRPDATPAAAYYPAGQRRNRNRQGRCLC